MKEQKINMQIREMRMDEVERIAEIEAICFPKAEAAPLERFVERVKEFGDCFLVAEVDERIVGFINGMVTNQNTIADIMFEDASLHQKDGMWQSVFGLDVLPEYRCRGIAAELMYAFIEKARIEGRRGCTLTCKERLIPYYSKFGYCNCGVSESQHGGAVWYDMLLEF